MDSGKDFKVIGVELSKEAVEDANANALANGLCPPRYIASCSAAEAGIEGMLDAASKEYESVRSVESPNSGVVAVVDPPRTGLHPNVCRALRAQNAVTRVVFVSCNPKGLALRNDYVVRKGTLAHNAKVLCAHKGKGRPFILTAAVPVDIFPHTPHTELVCVFERENP